MKTIPLLAAAALGAGLAVSAMPALAGVSASEAVTTCKNEVAARYGDEARTKIHRVRERAVTKVTLTVRGVGEEAFRVQCNVDGKRQVTELTDNRGNTVSTGTTLTTGG